MTTAPFASVDDAETWLLHHTTAWPREKYTLERMSVLMKALGDPQHDYRVIHVAGTSGKTSVSYHVRALLQRAGMRTGLTVSPHLLSLAERVQLDGRPLEEPLFVNELAEFLAAIQALPPITFYETMTAFALWEFSRARVDYAVVEVGIGGLIDASNVVKRADKICLICHIGLDHTEILGDTIEAIAAEKAGIVHPGNSVCIQPQDEPAISVLRSVARRRGGTIRPPRDQHRNQHGEPHGELLHGDQMMPGGLRGFAAENFALALDAYALLSDQDGLPVLTQQDCAAAAAAVPAGRFESFTVHGKRLVLDGAHNEQKLQALRQRLNLDGVEQANVCLAVLEGPLPKRHAMVAEIGCIAGQLTITEVPGVPRMPGKQSLPAAVLGAEATQARLPVTTVTVVPDWVEAVKQALAGPCDVTVVTGSLYLVALVRRWLTTQAGVRPWLAGDHPE